MRKIALLAALPLLLGSVAAEAGYLWYEDFNAGFPPTGWTVIDNTGNGAWQLNTFFGYANWTGGDGTCAMVDSDGYGMVNLDTELISMSFVVPSGATVEFDTNYMTYTGADYADTDISIDGGSNWINLLSWHGAADEQGTFMGLPGAHASASISAYAGETAQIRFHYYNANWEWYWQVDNVGVTPEPASLLLLGLGGLLLRRR